MKTIKKYEINISGSGTVYEIIHALQGIVDDLKSPPDELDGVQWEDETLLTEINEIDELEDTFI